MVFLGSGSFGISACFYGWLGGFIRLYSCIDYVNGVMEIEMLFFLSNFRVWIFFRVYAYRFRRVVRFFVVRCFFFVIVLYRS